jgi:transcriptional regulator with XRE-family HTH domain
VPKSAPVIFREKIRILRKEKGWTQEKAAEVCGVPYKLFQHYELGIKKNPGLLTLEKIAGGFGLTVGEFFQAEKKKSERTRKRPD